MSVKMYRQQGVGMVEILIALLVMSIGVLGYAGLQLRALGSSEEAYVRSQAMAIAQDAVERIAANGTGRTTYANTGSWPANLQTARPANWLQCVTADCDGGQMALWDIAQLAWMASDLLPAGRINAAACSGSSALCVRVAWNGGAPADCENAGGAVSDRNCIVLEVVR